MSVIFRAYKCRLEATPGQIDALVLWESVARFVWNIGLDQRRMWLESHTFINYKQQCAHLTEAKSEPELGFLALPPAQVLQQTLKDLDRTCWQYSVWETNFKSKRYHRYIGLRFPDGKRLFIEKLNRRHDRILLSKLGWVKYVSSQNIKGTVKSATIVRERSEWFISILAELPDRKGKHKNPGSCVGVDRGVKVTVVTSENQLWDKPAATQHEQHKYKRLQRKLARQQKGSRNYYKTLDAMAVIRGRTIHRKESFINKTVHTLTESYETIVLEDLKVTNMTKTAKGTIESPGRKVRQKSGLNRAILAKGWGQLKVKLLLKAQVTGSTVILVDPKFTSLTCSECGYRAKENRESQAIFSCQHCNHTVNADVNAAKNIRTRGQQTLTECSGGSPVSVPPCGGPAGTSRKPQGITTPNKNPVKGEGILNL